MQHINLETFANGAFTAQVNRAIEEVTKIFRIPIRMQRQREKLL